MWERDETYNKKIATGLSILILGILIDVVGTFFSLRVFTTFIVNQTFSAWYSTAWDAYYEEKPQVALRALEKVLDFYENEYFGFGSQNGIWSVNVDIIRLYTKAAILSDSLGYDDKYKKYIKAALAISKRSEGTIFNKLRSEKDLLEHQRSWEEALKKHKEEHNNSLDQSDSKSE